MDWTESNIKSLKDSLYHILNLAILEIKLTNPKVASRGGKFLVRDMAQGLFVELGLSVGKDILFYKSD